MLQISLQCHARARLNFVFILHLGCGVLMSWCDHVTCTSPLQNPLSLKSLSELFTENGIFTSSLSLPSSLSLLAFVFLVLIISSIFCSISHLCFWLLTESVRGGNTECHLSNSFSLLFSLSMKYLYGRSLVFFFVSS